ncbi:PREDICTED: uncharacterized protein LOC106806930 [Priapulus caudatus]|uniref:Uncharacterized protein LOC106806930 n=1 Tax=Priapulus caudatus TaxID=37621 RepID=A0ABM1DXC4_PRICU|nr:PREDICTED: uncharacterized protein LOC106806930 [Priapulus caudatus]
MRWLRYNPTSKLVKLAFLALSDSSIFVCGSAQHFLGRYLGDAHSIQEAEELPPGGAAALSDPGFCIRQLVGVAFGDAAVAAATHRQYDGCERTWRSERARTNAMQLLVLLSETGAVSNLVALRCGDAEALATLYDSGDARVCEASTGLAVAMATDVAELRELVRGLLRRRGFTRAALMLAAATMRRFRHGNTPEWQEFLDIMLEPVSVMLRQRSSSDGRHGNDNADALLHSLAAVKSLVADNSCPQATHRVIRRPMIDMLKRTLVADASGRSHAPPGDRVTSAALGVVEATLDGSVTVAMDNDEAEELIVMLCGAADNPQLSCPLVVQVVRILGLTLLAVATEPAVAAELEVALEAAGDVLNKRSLDVRWEVRDSCLACLCRLAGCAPLSDWLVRGRLHGVCYRATNDAESYVRATAIEATGALFNDDAHSGALWRDCHCDLSN